MRNFLGVCLVITFLIGVCTVPVFMREQKVEECKRKNGFYDSQESGGIR